MKESKKTAVRPARPTISPFDVLALGQFRLRGGRACGCTRPARLRSAPRSQPRRRTCPPRSSPPGRSRRWNRSNFSLGFWILRSTRSWSRFIRSALMSGCLLNLFWEARSRKITHRCERKKLANVSRTPRPTGCRRLSAGSQWGVGGAAMVSCRSCEAGISDQD